MGEVQTADTPLTPFSPGPKKFPSQLKTLKCTYDGCDKTFNRPSRLKTHLRAHTDERPFVCKHDGCDKAYIDEKHLKQHIKSSHSSERPYPCERDGCGKTFLTGTRLRRHEKVHEGQNRFRCSGYPPCGQSFRKHQTLERHIRSEHMELAPFQCTYVDPITRIQCVAGFDGSGGLRKHQERAHAILEYFCPECIHPDSFALDGTSMHLGFPTEAKLQAHINKEHATCPFCDRKCASKRELDKHVETQHSGTALEERKKIPCTYNGCKSTFTKKYNLGVHIRSAHEGQRYICGTFDVSAATDLASWDMSEGCGEPFVSKANLQDHVRTAHLGLSSVINANRKKRIFTSADEDDLLVERKRRKQRAKPSALDELLGFAYDNDERRTIPCIVSDCPHQFMRDHDLQRHLRSHHRLATSDIDDIIGEFHPNTGLVSQTWNDTDISAYRQESIEELNVKQEEGINWDSQDEGLGAEYMFTGLDAGMSQAE